MDRLGPLGTHPAMAELVLHRYDEALSTRAPITDLRGAGPRRSAAAPQGATGPARPALAV